TQGGELPAPARGASRTRTLFVPAEMAAEALAPRAMEDQRHGTIRATDRGAASGAEQGARVATPVQEQNRLLSAPKRLPQRPGQLGSEQLVGNPPLDHGDGRLRPGLDSLRKPERAQLPLLRAAQRLQRRGGAAEDRDRSRPLRAHQREIAGVIAQSLL